MKKLLKTIAAIMLATNIVPACISAEETLRYHATETEIENHGTLVSTVELAGATMSILPTLASGVVAYLKTYNALAATSTYLATGVAIPSALIAGLATTSIFALPLMYVVRRCKKTFNDEAVSKILRNGRDKSDRWMTNALFVIPAAIVALYRLQLQIK